MTMLSDERERLFMLNELRHEGLASRLAEEVANGISMPVLIGLHVALERRAVGAMLVGAGLMDEMQGSKEG